MSFAARAWLRALQSRLDSALGEESLRYVKLPDGTLLINPSFFSYPRNDDGEMTTFAAKLRGDCVPNQRWPYSSREDCASVPTFSEDEVDVDCETVTIE